MASIYTYDKSAYSVSLRLTNLDTNWAKGTRTVTWELGTSNDGYYSEKENGADLSNGVSEGGDAKFTGLSPGTTYYVLCKVHYGSELLSSITGKFTTSSVSVEISRWSWTSSNGRASAQATSTAYNAINDKANVLRFNYLVWNDMVDKVREILDVLDEKWDNKYATYGGTQMSPSDKTLTATRFNSLRYNVDIHYSTGITERSPGDTVYGWYFTKLAQSINGWINKI